MSPLPKELNRNLKKYEDCFSFASFKKVTQMKIIQFLNLLCHLNFLNHQFEDSLKQLVCPVETGS